MPKCYLVSRHPATIDWIKEQTHIDQVVEHLNTEIIPQRDTDVRTLPVQLAAELCERSGKYLHFKLNFPKEMRGKELSYGTLQQCEVQSTEYPEFKQQGV